MPWPVKMLIRIFPVLIVVYLYTGWRISTALLSLSETPAWRIRLPVLLAIFFFNLLPLAILYSYQSGNGGNLFLLKPTLQREDYWMTYPFWFGLIVVVEILPYFLSLEILSGIFRFIPAVPKESWLKWRAALQLGLAAFFVAYVGIRLYSDTNRVRLQRYEIKIENLSPALQNFSLAFISDVQVDRYTRSAKLERFREQLEKANGKMLLFGGDIVTSGERYISPANELLCAAEAPLGRIACMGDHDFWANPVRIENGLIACGWEFLQDRHHLVEYQGSKILVTGITYIYSRRISPAGLRELLENAPEADLKILLVHQPSNMVIKAAQEFGYHLLLAGHTHGGQVVFRPFGIPLAASRLESTFYSGYGEYQNMPVIVTTGVGLTLAPVRYQAPAEVVKVVFTGKQQRKASNINH